MLSSGRGVCRKMNDYYVYQHFSLIDSNLLAFYIFYIALGLSFILGISRAWNLLSENYLSRDFSLVSIDGRLFFYFILKASVDPVSLVRGGFLVIMSDVLSSGL